MTNTATIFVEGGTYPAILNCAPNAFHVVEIDAKLIVWVDDGTEEWACLDDMKRRIDVE